jgi:putative transcriptional regulator
MAKNSNPNKEEVWRRRDEIAARARAGDLRLPEAVRDLRDALGLSRAEFSRKVLAGRISPRQLASIEKGHGNPSARTLTTICLAFGFQLGYVPRKITPLAYFAGVPDAWRRKPSAETRDL